MSNVEFLIHQVQQDGEVTRVSGIVNMGKVSLNTEFVSVRSESGGESPVLLKVSNIVAYRRQVAELPTGMSGELHMSGDGVGQLGKHCMLTA
jgi:hypothetical protein